MTTYAGRLAFSEPSPYVSQDPIDGRPGCSDPVRKNVIAGAWFTDAVNIDFTKQRSSAIPAVRGR